MKFSFRYSKLNVIFQFRKYSSLLINEYDALKEKIFNQPLLKSINPQSIFANNELNLDEIDVYGFDYDYTIAEYTKTLDKLIYDYGTNVLIQDYKYPKDIALIEYDPNFAIRGLHCDVQKGYLLKVDAFHYIQTETVYRGLTKVKPQDVRRAYNGLHISSEILVSNKRAGSKMYQLMDLFAVPAMNLYANINEFFIQHDVVYEPDCVFYDVQDAISKLHKNKIIHGVIERNMSLYLNKDERIRILLQRLLDAGKKMFLVTNSSTKFVDSGMNYLVGSDWIQFFDVVITNASKPEFFQDETRHFRLYDAKIGLKSWNRVTNLAKGSYYQGGNFYELASLTGWTGDRILYFGDHVYTDLADPTLKLGWRTGAIIPEIRNEIEIMNLPEFKQTFTWLMALEELISEKQTYNTQEECRILQEWRIEHKNLRDRTASFFNPQFGSIFRTHHNGTFFCRRFKRFSDIYTSSLINLLNFTTHHTFFPRRSALSHELHI